MSCSPLACEPDRAVYSAAVFSLYLFLTVALESENVTDRSSLTFQNRLTYDCIRSIWPSFLLSLNGCCHGIQLGVGTNRRNCHIPPSLSEKLMEKINISRRCLVCSARSSVRAAALLILCHGNSSTTCEVALALLRYRRISLFCIICIILLLWYLCFIQWTELSNTCVLYRFHSWVSVYWWKCIYSCHTKKPT